MTTTSLQTPAPSSDLDSCRLDDDGGPAWGARPDPDTNVRLVWAPPGGSTRLDAVWWPRSREATTELRALLPIVRERLGGAATRVSLNIDAWSADQPRRLRIGDTLVRLGWFHTLDPTTVTLGHGGEDRRSVLVIPPDWNSSVARELLRHLSAARHWPDTAGETLQLSAACPELPPCEK